MNKTPTLLVVLLLVVTMFGCGNSDKKDNLPIGSFTLEFDEQSYSYSNSRGLLSPGISLIKDYWIFFVNPTKIGKGTYDNASLQIQFTDSGDDMYNGINLARFLTLLSDKKPNIGVQLSITAPDGHAIVYYDIDIREVQDAVVNVAQDGEDYTLKTLKPIVLKKGKISGIFNKDMPKEIQLSFQISTKNASKL